MLIRPGVSTCCDASNVSSTGADGCAPAATSSTTTPPSTTRPPRASGAPGESSAVNTPSGSRTHVLVAASVLVMVPPGGSSLTGARLRRHGAPAQWSCLPIQVPRVTRPGRR
ncbi:Uncharacterised protein [Mycobacteroides abscessus]|nr:Uncharacterised protein [Mycobacteroides abscessus]